MRLEFIIIFCIMIIALSVCAVIAWRSPKAMGRPVALLVAGLLPPVIGNVIIIASGQQLLSTIGCYIYFLGMDFVMFTLVGFTVHYCRLRLKSSRYLHATYALLAVDVVQLLLNPFFGQAFTTEPIMVEGYYYFRLVPFAGQMFHRAAIYAVFLTVIVIFIVKAVRAPRIYAERYWIILFVMIFTGAWESFYIFSRTPIDQSMTGFGVFGLLVFYFALYYRPLRLLDRMLAGVASELPEGLFFFDQSGGCIWANRRAMEMTGISGEEEYDLVADRISRKFGDLGKDQQEWALQYVSDDGDDAEYYVLAKHSTPDTRGGSAGFYLSIRDNTEDQRALRRERYNATHDGLTGLFTRDYLEEKIRQTLEKNPDRDYLIIFINVNEFKIVNDIFGNDFGDFALQRIADWIRENMNDDCVYGRLGGDTFGICMPAEAFDPDRLREQLTDFRVADGSVEHSILIHLGVYEVTEKDLEVSVMFDRARLALSTIRDEYQTHVAYYDDEMRKVVLWNQHISTQLPDAIEQRQVEPWLQPIVGENGEVVGAEVLVRWNHPEDGLLTPDSFVPAFERNGMIGQLDRYMWRRACEILAQWKHEGKDLFLSVNISPRDFYFIDVKKELQSAVDEYGLDPSLLRVEITETVMMTDVRKRIRILEDLKERGFFIEMDDFGSGYSSLNMLKDMPVDLIKIDMTFLEKSENEAKARTILREIITLSEQLGILTLTEGVETEEQHRMLTRMGCRLFQGYHFARPMPLQNFEEYCRQQCERS